MQSSGMRHLDKKGNTVLHLAAQGETETIKIFDDENWPELLQENSGPIESILERYISDLLTEPTLVGITKSFELDASSDATA